MRHSSTMAASFPHLIIMKQLVLFTGKIYPSIRPSPPISIIQSHSIPYTMRISNPKKEDSIQIAVGPCLMFIQPHKRGIPDRLNPMKNKGNSIYLKKKQRSVIFQTHFTWNCKEILPRDWMITSITIKKDGLSHHLDARERASSNVPCKKHRRRYSVLTLTQLKERLKQGLPKCLETITKNESFHFQQGWGQILRV